MEKLDLISNIYIWLDMRDIQNRIVHDSVPEKIVELYQLIRGEFYTELNQMNKKITLIDSEG